jgi:hypothetical protein
MLIFLIGFPRYTMRECGSVPAVSERMKVFNEFVSMFVEPDLVDLERHGP